MGEKAMKRKINQWHILTLVLSGLLLGGCGGESNEVDGLAEEAPAEVPSPSVATFDLNACMSGCDVADEERAKACKAGCWDNYAVATLDPDKCDNNLELLNNDATYFLCLEDVARAMKDPSPCGKLDSGKPDSGNYRNQCYMDLAEYLVDLNVCDNIAGSEKGNTDRQVCIENVMNRLD